MPQQRIYSIIVTNPLEGLCDSILALRLWRLTMSGILYLLWVVNRPKSVILDLRSFGILDMDGRNDWLIQTSRAWRANQFIIYELSRISIVLSICVNFVWQLDSRCLILLTISVNLIEEIIHRVASCDGAAWYSSFSRVPIEGVSLIEFLTLA